MEERVQEALELYPTLDNDKIESIFTYCDGMRESMNPYGLRPYIAEMFGMGKREAGVYLEAWMKTYV